MDTVHNTSPLAELYQQAEEEKAQGNLVTARAIFDEIINRWLFDAWEEHVNPPQDAFAVAMRLRAGLVLSKWEYATFKQALHGPKLNDPSHVNFLADVVKAYCLKGGAACRAE